MNIIVLVKQVPDTSEVRINRETNTLIATAYRASSTRTICTPSRRRSASGKSTGAQ